MTRYYFIHCDGEITKSDSEELAQQIYNDPNGEYLVLDTKTETIRVNNDLQLVCEHL